MYIVYLFSSILFFRSVFRCVSVIYRFNEGATFFGERQLHVFSVCKKKWIIRICRASGTNKVVNYKWSTAQARRDRMGYRTFFCSLIHSNHRAHTISIVGYAHDVADAFWGWTSQPKNSHLLGEWATRRLVVCRNLTSQVYATNLLLPWHSISSIWVYLICNFSMYLRT